MMIHSTAQTLDTPPASARPLTRHVPTAARGLVGLVFFASGVLGLLMATGIIHPPQQAGSDGATAFMGALAKTGYMFALIKATETTVGILLLCNRFVPLALTILAPLLVNIVAFHVFLAPAGVALPLVLAALSAYLAWGHRKAYRPLLTPKT